MVAVDDARKIREKKSAVEGSSLSTVYQTTRYPSTNLQSVTLALEAESTWIVVASPGQAVCPNHQHTMDLRISTSDLSSTYSASVLLSRTPTTTCSSTSTSTNISFQVSALLPRDALHYVSEKQDT